MRLILKRTNAWDITGEWKINWATECQVLDIDNPTPGRILAALRERGYLTPEESKGKVLVNQLPRSYACWEVCIRSTGEPIYLLQEIQS